MRLTIILIMLAVTAQTAAAQARGQTGKPDVSTQAALPAPACGEINRRIEVHERTMSTTDVEGIGDTSAPSATLREARIANDLQVIAINLGLLAPLHCAPRRLPVYPLAYFGNALDCSHEELKGVKDSPKCNRDTWKREYDTPSDSSHRKP